MALFSAAAIGDVQKIQSLIDSEDKSEDSIGVDVNCSDASGKTPLHIASANGHLQTVKCLTNHGAKVNVIDANLQTSVHLCSKKGHLHVVELLVNEGADIKIGDKDGFTALHIASFEGHVDIVKYLVSKGAELERLANDYWTPLHLALNGGHLDLAEYLLTEGANINSCGEGGCTALHAASQTGNIDGVKYLTSQGAEQDKITEDGWTALSLASFRGHLDIVKVLVNEGVQVDKALRNGMTPLCLATEKGHLGIVEVLLNVGANIDDCNRDGLTALHIAASNGHVEIVHHLISKGAHLDKCDKTERTPLFCASQKGHLEIVEYIVNKGAGIEIGNKDGFTALHSASLKGHLDNVKYLVSKGSDLGRLANDYWTPLHLALDGGRLDIAEYLLTEGANINTCGKRGYTALHTASQTGNIDGVKYLTSQGAELDRSTDDGWTALSLASFGGHLDIVKVFVNKGVEVDKALKNGTSSLCLATERGHLGIVEVLLNVGSNIDSCNQDGGTALHNASFKGHLDIVKCLLMKGAQLNKCNKNDRTPLSCASQEGHLEVVEYIVNKRADIEIGDKDGFTALHLAAFAGHFDIVKYLVSKGADLWRLADDYWTPSGLALYGGHLDIHDFLLNREARKIVKPFIGFEEDHYDYLRSTFGSKALPSLMPRPYSPTYDPYLTSKQDSSSSSRKSITEETMIISLDEYSIKVPLSPDDVDRAKYITAEALTTIPPDLNLDKDEVIISVGLKLSPPGLQFKTPVEVTVSHSAIFTNPDKAEIVLYTRRTGSDEFSRIVPGSDKAARCVVAKNHLTLYLDHFSEWWIISLIRRYFIGKRLICTPYVPLSTSRDVMNYILLNIKDDFYGMKEDTIRDYKEAFPGEQYCVYWGQGSLFVRHLENEDEVSTQELEECAFFHMTTHRMPFTLQPREASEVPVKFILKQKITKRIAFKVLYNDVPHEIPNAKSTPTGSASSKGKAESHDVGRGTSKSSQLFEELTRSEHHDLETIGSTSPEPADTKGKTMAHQERKNDISIRGSSPTKVLTRPSPLTSSTESLSREHAYQVTPDLITETGVIGKELKESIHSLESAAEGKMGAPPAILANIVRELVPVLSTDRNMHQRSGNVYINVQGMVINNPQGNNPQGNTVAHAPVAIASIVPPMLQHELRCRLNRESPVFDDWRGLASELGLGDYIQHLEQCKNPTEELLVLAESQKKIQNLGDLCKAFERMNRGDCQELCENYAFERTKSADPRKDQMEYDDTDISD
ncbi:ankyrin-1-like [Strongylocentrotus purpuratus]|uniref:Death domain-containing protein n=1 Tax=Strongylocentrotus purpuratus TaxID=7668 RepID=A0A7M7SZR7_STRPU|nr:ankyrin-1-like [Strongylocentrotus purpuratus]